MRVSTPLFVLVVALLNACASRGHEGEAPRTRVSSDQTRLLPADFTDLSHTNMWEVINQRRPHWLRPAAGASGMHAYTQDPTIYVDGNRSGGVELLRSISASAVAGARYLSTSEAQARYGLVATGPVIELTTTGKKP